MILKELLSYIFNKSNNNELTNYSYNVVIPNRKFFQDNLSMLYKIDFYKEKYINILNTNKVLVSKNLKIDNMEKEIKFNSDMLLHLVYKEDNSYIDNLLKVEKLKLYMQNYTETLSIVIAKINALEEIKEENVFKFLRSKKAINEEINNLKFTFVRYYQEIQAIIMEVKTCISNINNSIMDDDKINMLLREKFYIVSNYLDILKISNNFSYNINNIAQMEYLIEKYVYDNNKELDSIYYEITDMLYTVITPNNLHELLKKVNNLLLKINIFKDYSRNKVDDNKIYELYLIKFNIYTKYINYNFDSDSPFIVNTKKELYYYKKIIMDIITGLATNKKVEQIFDYDKYNAIDYIRNVLRNDKGIIDAEGILKDAVKLKLISVFNPYDDKNTIDLFFDNISLDRFIKTINEYKDYSHLNLSKTISLKSAYDYIDVFENKTYKNLKNIYNLLKVRKNHKGNYYLTKDFDTISNYYYYSGKWKELEEKVNENFSRNYEWVYYQKRWAKSERELKYNRLTFSNGIKYFEKPVKFNINFTMFVLNDDLIELNVQSIPKSVIELSINKNTIINNRIIDNLYSIQYLEIRTNDNEIDINYLEKIIKLIFFKDKNNIYATNLRVLRIGKDIIYMSELPKIEVFFSNRDFYSNIIANFIKDKIKESRVTDNNNLTLKREK